MWDEFEEKVTRLFEFTNGRKSLSGATREAAGL